MGLLNFKTKKYWSYWRRARHRGGFGIHSPFLFHQITQVIEDKERVSDYQTLRVLRKEIVQKLKSLCPQKLTPEQFELLSDLKSAAKLVDQFELPRRHIELVYRLVRERKPNLVQHYGPTLGLLPEAIKLAAPDARFEISHNPFTDLFPISQKPKVLTQGKANQGPAEWIYFNLPTNPQLVKTLLEKALEKRGEKAVWVIHGIHQNQAMESVWKMVVAWQPTRITLDLFEVGIIFFHEGLQKENFILRF